MPDQASSPSVRRGAHLMDQLYPDWYNTIKLPWFDMGNACACVLGQLFGHYILGVHRVIARDSEMRRKGHFDAVHHGMRLANFASRSDLLPNTYEELTRQWENEIRARRSQAATAASPAPNPNPPSPPSPHRPPPG